MHPRLHPLAAVATVALVFVVATTIISIDRAEAGTLVENLKRPLRATARGAKFIRTRVQGISWRPNVIYGRPPPSPVQPRAAADDDDDVEVRADRDGDSGGGGGGGGGRGDNTEGGGGGGGDDFSAMCLFARGPSLRKPPSFFYFSPKLNKPGCEAQLQLEVPTIEDENRELDEQATRSLIQDKLLAAQIYDPSKPTYFLIHGFLASWNSGNWLCNTKDLILENTQANVFIVDWSGGSKPLLPVDYGAAVVNTEYVASLIGDFVLVLMQMTGQQDAKQFRLVGHSLGAHISGFIGYRVGSIGQIVALDPAGPCFHSHSSEQRAIAAQTGQLHDGKRRLSPASADYVLALHTDTALFGLNENCGHYDVYVNGGSKQPGCSQSGFTGRLNELFSGHLLDTFDPDITCGHSYAHNLLHEYLSLDALSDLRDLLLGGDERGQFNTGLTMFNPDKLEKCYPMAYECASFDAFTAGECGFCRDNDRRCVYAGLSRENIQPLKDVDQDEYSGWQDKPSDGSGDDDKEINSEIEESSSDSDKTEGEHSHLVERHEATKRNCRGQHFMRTAEGGETSMFQYQIIVAARRSRVDTIPEEELKGYFYYLQLPLDDSGSLSGASGDGSDGDNASGDDKQPKEAPYSRLVQVSHRLDPESPAYWNLKTIYIDALKERLASGGGANPNLDESRDDLDFYSALITFKQMPERECGPDRHTNGQVESKDKWKLCDTLDQMRQARLWAQNREKLDAVAWVSMNYMSGVTYEQRMSKSFVMQRDTAISERDTLAETTRAHLDDLRPDRSKSIGHTIDDAADKADCLVQALNKNSRKKIKCRKDEEELRFALDLSTTRL